jgi:DNA-binding MarR family transcriptional regulator
MHDAYIGGMTDARSTNLLGALVTALHDDLDQAVASAADHGSAFPAALVSVHWQPGVTIEVLRRVLGLSHSGTVRLVDRLEQEGSLDRRAGPDGRSVALHLTAQGRRQVKAVLDGRFRVLNGALGLLSAAEQKQLAHLTEKLLAGLTRDRPHSDHICRLCDESVCPDDRCPVGCAVAGTES